MLSYKDIISLRMQRQYLSFSAGEAEYDALFSAMPPVPTLYWCAPGSPPTLPPHAGFDDYAYNSLRRSGRDILKGRFAGGSIAYVAKEDLELFACLFKKDIGRFTYEQAQVIELLGSEGAMNIGLLKQLLGRKVKDITPVLHKLQEAFIVYEDQVDNKGDRAWYLFEREFADIDINRYKKTEALRLALPRFARLCVFFDETMLRSYYKLPQKDIKPAVDGLLEEGIIKAVELESKSGYILTEDAGLQGSAAAFVPPVLLLQRNDFMVRANADELKARFISEHDTLYYLLIDGELRGAVTGRFKFGPHIIEDIVLDLPLEEKIARKDEILGAVYTVFDRQHSPVRRYDGVQL